LVLPSSIMIRSTMRAGDETTWVHVGATAVPFVVQ
jgi:hypothetical protein